VLLTITTAQFLLLTSAGSIMKPKFATRLAIALRSRPDLEESPLPARPVTSPMPVSWLSRRPCMLPMSLIRTVGTARAGGGLTEASANRSTPAASLL
jgi:hypothetical protein